MEFQPPVPTLIRGLLSVLLMFVLSCYLESYPKQKIRGNDLPHGLFHVLVGSGEARTRGWAPGDKGIWE